MTAHNRVLATALSMALWSVSAHAAPSDAERYVVVLRDGAGRPADVAAEVAQGAGGRVGYVYEHALRGFSILMPRQAVAQLARDPRVASVEKDLPMSIVAQTVPTGLRRAGAATNPALAIDGVDDRRVDVDVAILDTGIDFQHPDLNVVGGANCLQTSSGGPRWSKSFYCDPNVSSDDDHYHGTHVAGTVGALDNGIGVVGVAPGARLWAVKVLDSAGSGYTSGIIAGIDWVVAHKGIEVMNMSLGGSGISDAYRVAIDNAVAKGVVVVVAAGNSDADANNYSPAFVPSAITVSALADFDGAPGGFGSATCRADQDDTLADFSNWGTAVDIAAPGVCILSTYPLERGEYAEISGTSMASPHVAGAAALLASGDAAPTDAAGVAAIRDRLRSAGNFNWVDDSGDGVQEPLLAVDGFTPRLVDVGGGGGGGGGGGNTPPVAAFSVQCTTLECVFDASGSSDADGVVSAFAWDFGDGATASGVLQTHAYAADGTYQVTLQVTDDAGATASVAEAVTVAGGGGGGGGETLSASSTSEGSSWTARVTSSTGQLTGSWSVGGGSCAGDTCTRSGIPKKQSSVTFTASGSGTTVVVLKP